MPTVNVKGARYYFEDSGGEGEPVVLSHGLLFDRRMFDPLVRDLSPYFRCVAFDWRGQGRSETTRSGYDMDALADDAATLITTLGLAPCHFVGASMGGFAGLRLAIRRPQLLRSLVLMSAPAEAWPLRIAAKMLVSGLVTRVFGLRPILGQVMSAFFGPTFNKDPERAEERRFWREQILAVDRVGVYRTIVGLVFRRGVAGDLHRIATPTLIIAGEEDVNFPPSSARTMAEHIPSARVVTIPHAGHYAAVEQPKAVSEAVAAFLGGVGVTSTAQASGA